VIAAVRDTMPVDQVHQISVPTCERMCLITTALPADRACPYAFDVLGREPTADGQRAARREAHCAGIGFDYRYYGGIGSNLGLTVVVEPEAAGAAGNIAAADTGGVAAAMRAGAVVVDDPRYLDNGRVTLRISTPTPEGRIGESRSVSVPGYAPPRRLPARLAMMTAATARSLGFGTSPLTLLATTTRMPTQAETDRLSATLGNGYNVGVERGPQSNSANLIVLAIVAGVIALGAAAIATGLAAADGRADLATLAAVGASPRVRRVLSLSQSGVIAGLGSLLGAASGLGMSAAVLFALNRRFTELWPAPTPYPLTVPWLNLSIALLVVPAVAMLGAGLLTRSRLPAERRI
jgi:putative ABC transport system permease protein